MRRKIIDTSCGPIDLSGLDYCQLPYTLTKGVLATQEGLVVDNDASESVVHVTLQWLGRDRLSGYAGRIFDWPDAAERLRYREGEPWCTSSYGAITPAIVCYPGTNKATGLSGYIFGEPIKDNPLHRLAAILCDDAQAFRVLHWCVTNCTQISTKEQT